MRTVPLDDIDGLVAHSCSAALVGGAQGLRHSRYSAWGRDLEGLVDKGQGDRPISTVRTRCSVCGGRGVWQVRPAINQGVVVEVASKDQKALGPSGLTILRALADEKGLRNVRGALLSDDDMKNTANRHGVIHIVVGTTF